MLVLRRQLCQNQRAAVTRTVVNKDNIVIIGLLLHNSGSMLVKFVQVIFFIKYRHYQRNFFLHYITPLILLPKNLLK